MIHRKIAIIGAGKVGSALGIVLQDAGYDIVGVLSRSFSSAERLAAQLNCPVCTAYPELLQAADIVLLTVPDRAIGETAAKLVQSGVLKNQQAIFHVCGAQSADSLACIRTCKIPVGSMHPLQSFVSPERAAEKIAGTYFAVDGDLSAIVIAQEMIAALGGVSMVISPNKRALYHAAACMASNYLVSIMHGAVAMMDKCGVPEKMAMQALQPLMQGTLVNLQKEGTVQALTGPIVRGDALTLRGQLSQIDAESPEEAALYRALGEYTVNIAAKKNAWSVDQSEAMKNQFVK